MSTIGYNDIVVWAEAAIASVVCTAEAPLAVPMMARLENSAEHGRKVLETRLLDDVTELDTWFFRGQCTMTFPDRGRMRHVGAGGSINGLQPATGRNRGLPAATLKRAFAGEDGTGPVALGRGCRSGR